MSNIYNLYFIILDKNITGTYTEVRLIEILNATLKL